MIRRNLRSAFLLANGAFCGLLFTRSMANADLRADIAADPVGWMLLAWEVASMAAPLLDLHIRAVERRARRRRRARLYGEVTL